MTVMKVHIRKLTFVLFKPTHGYLESMEFSHIWEEEKEEVF